MCGIGIRYKNGHCDFNKMSHRGIESKSIMQGDYTMWHARLPLQTEQGDDFGQPIELPGGWFLMFNGEIFNPPEKHKNDVDYLIQFFSQKDWKIRVLRGDINFWDGFWAISLCNPRTSEVYAFTDPLGKKQLYFKNGCLASEIKPLIDQSGFSLYYDPDKIWTVEDTPFKGVFRICPNTLYKFKGDQLCATYPSELVRLKKTRVHVKQDLVHLIEKSVNIRKVNSLDVNSILVSGGLDSTIILSHFRKSRSLKKLDLLTIENEGDEPYIKIIEDWLEVPVRRIKIPEKPKLKNIVKAYEHPLDLGSLIPQYYLCKEAKGSVIYTGDGADELFSGYNRAQTLDTQEYDIFRELPYYHNLRLDRMGMVHTKEIRSPFMSHDLVRYAWNTPWTSRIGKKQLKDAYWDLIPRDIITRDKNPLRVAQMRGDREAYRKTIKSMFYKLNFMK